MNKYIVLTSGNIGGAEKRFFDIFRGLVELESNIYLVLPSCLVKILEKEVDLSHYSANLIVLQVDEWSPLKFSWYLFWKLFVNLRSNDVVHYPLNPLFFFHFFVRAKFTMSLCHCYALPKLSWRKKALSLQYLATFFAKKVDILSPDIYDKALASHSRYRRKTYLTPGGSYIYQKRFELENKTPSCMFLSRLEEQKGTDVLFKLIPLIDSQMEKKAGIKLKFNIYGKGSLEQTVVNKVASLTAEGVDVEYLGYRNHLEVMPESWISLSLQAVTNYPSRVVVESLLNGCEVIILDTGDSRLFGESRGVHYLLTDFSNLGEVVDKITSSIAYSNSSNARAIMRSAKEKYCSDSYIRYFDELLG